MPPVTETAMGFEFPALSGIDLVELLALRESWPAGYTKVETHPSLEPTSFAAQGPPAIQISTHPLVRFWASSERGDGLLVQWQHDRLLLNWRKAFDALGKYPGYEPVLLPAFQELWSIVTKQLARSGGVATPILAEYSYYNLIPVALDQDPHTVLRVLGQVPEGWQGRQLQVVYETRIHVPSGSEEVADAQVSVQCVPARAGQEGAFMLSVIAKTPVAGSGDDHAFAALSHSHEAAANAFFDAITDEYRQRWGAER